MVVVAVHVSYNPLLVAFVVFATLEVLAVKSVAVICCSISVRRRYLRCWLLSRLTSHSRCLIGDTVSYLSFGILLLFVDICCIDCIVSILSDRYVVGCCCCFIIC